MKSQFLLAALLLIGGCGALPQQMADPKFDASVQAPAFTREHPLVSVDEAHHNFHKASGRYAPFAELLRNDGYNVQSGTTEFSAKSLSPFKVLIISNAGGGSTSETFAHPAFTEQECDAVLEWVRQGGSLLLIADHAPFGSAASNLALRFGVKMGEGYVLDPDNSTDSSTWLLFSRQNALLGDHPIVRGRGNADTVNRVVAFTGQSLSVPAGATALLMLGKTAYEANNSLAMGAAQVALTAHLPVASIAGLRPVQGAAQAIALNVGQGRVVITGEAAMFTAQIGAPPFPGIPGEKFGMNAPGNDDKLFVLNVMRWLSSAL